MTTVGEALVARLEAHGVDCVFGIPGVHTVELYRGLAASGIRHITPRHEQGAGFMADGYARVSGRPGVVFVITGPGLTNTLTPIGQARADSVPMLVISGVNRRQSLGRGMGHLHELPDQRAVAAAVALSSDRVERPGDLAPALDAAMTRTTAARPGPAHVEVPLDVAGLPGPDLPALPASPPPPAPDPAAIARAAERLAAARRPVILAGGGARGAALIRLAETLDAPVVQTVNARGLMHAHPLGVPASPSLNAVRALICDADLVLAIGTELGPTDYDMYDTGSMGDASPMIRIDICADQLARHDTALAICADAGAAVEALLDRLPPREAGDGAARADRARTAAWEEIGPAMRALTRAVEAMRDAVPGSIIVGDSTQPVYAGNLFFDHDRPGGWFNAATGFGALGYGIPAAIGAALAAPDTPVLCLTGDGGAQFTLPELMTAVDESLPITFIVWNNRGYGEIENAMDAAGVTVVGCNPSPPDFAHLAAACGLPFHRCSTDPGAIADTLRAARAQPGPSLLEINVANPKDTT
ncbi:5-guanidino-2-oxopentanoate decarboxylase [Pukyongiella litopenaei]|uniref:5-guanidino-2-oxopentanoate decarboxylase n=1 Tax=Pukyongiella litopenaei TaxID=2605946 RepID=A0A2S0MPZ9_9RHOB|nr:5-guanidino-2-oxopentanoate decarboxylase [Pukyongiella litopenaei]AVO37917.1 5-guanidino-2-oxopentanoate decarboxylase [Pukyongiella litopenaei]